MTVQKTNLEVYGMQNIRRLARKSHKPKRSRDFRAMEPLRKRLWRRIGFKQTETRCWAASQVCERCRLVANSACPTKPGEVGRGALKIGRRFERRHPAIRKDPRPGGLPEGRGELARYDKACAGGTDLSSGRYRGGTASVPSELEIPVNS